MMVLFLSRKILKTKKAYWIPITVLVLTVLGYGLHYIYKINYRYMPKPTGYHRIELPEPRYQLLEGVLPYRFTYSTHAKIVSSQSRFKNNYWLNIYYPMFDATIYISYKNFSNDTTLLKKLCKEASKLAFEHRSKASLIEEHLIQTPKGYQATVIELWGQVPTTFQFYTTDGKQHFLRGALYLNTASQNDFYEPIIEYIKKDIIHMLNTLEWVDVKKYTHTSQNRSMHHNDQRFPNTSQ